MFGESVTIYQRIDEDTDRGGATTYSYDTGTVVTGAACEPILLQTVSGEGSLIGRESLVQSRWRVYLPINTVINAFSRIRMRTVMYEIDGDPGDWISPYSQWMPGLVVLLRKVEG